MSIEGPKAMISEACCSIKIQKGGLNEISRLKFRYTHRFCSDIQTKSWTAKQSSHLPQTSKLPSQEDGDIMFDERRRQHTAACLEIVL